MAGRRITLSTAARILGCSVWTVRRMILRGELSTAEKRSRRPKSWWTVDASEVAAVGKERGTFHAEPS